jgi:hypothetical protein
MHMARAGHNLDSLDGDRVITFAEWCRINGFSEATGHRLKKRGEGPTFIQMSPRRIGVTVANNRKWQASRARQSAFA